MDFLNADFSQRHFSAPASGEVAQTQRRPSLASRSQSMGKSNRNLQDCRPPSLTSSGRAATEGRTSSDSSINWAFDSQGELATSFSELSDQDERLVGVSHSGPKKEGINSDEKDSHVRPTQTENIAGRKVGLKRGDSDSSGGVPQMLTTLERARRVALTMKTSAATNHLEDELGDNADFSNLMNIMENKRDQDSASIGSQSKLGSRKSISDSQSKGGASGFSGSNIRQGRPFSGITVSPFAGGESSNIDHLFQSAEMVHDLCQIPEGEEEEGCKCAVIADANATFLSLLNRSHPEVPSAFSEENEDTPQGEDGGVDEQTPMIGRPSIQSTPRGRFKKIFSPIISSVLHPNNGLYRFLVWWTGLRRQTRMLADAFDRAYVKETCWAFFQNEVTCQIVPALSVSAFCYYQLGNPVLSILPTDASVSWWILFAIRNYLTFQLAYTVQYLFVEVLAMRSLLSVQLIGPLATLYTINAKGWPFILTSWGVLNLLLIQDNHPTSIFFNHWLSWTDIEMFSAENPSGGVVESDLYKEVLMSMIIVGISIALKRTILALYLGKRIYTHYQPKLEKVMEAMILLSECADLGHAVDDFDFERAGSPDGYERRSTQLQDKVRATAMTDVVKKSASLSEPDCEDESLDEGIKSRRGSTDHWNRIRTGSYSSDENEPTERVLSQETMSREYSQSFFENESMDTFPNMETVESVPADDVHIPDHTTSDEYIDARNQVGELPALDSTEPPVLSVHEPAQGLLHKVSATARIRSLLDNWEEPVNKADKMADPTIQDILQFRKALSFLDDTHPFGSSYGPAFSRDSCIKSAKSLYVRLLALSPGSPVLHFDCLAVLAYNHDGTFDDRKAKSLVRLFRPGKFDEVSLLHFVQSCDGVYKKIRFLRASVGNSTLIDNVLENIFDAVFAFILALTVMSTLELNPWTLLLSMSTVLVSFAFALGPSAAKLIEGMIMIAVRRPFDLGDRISIAVSTTGAPDNSGDPGYHDTWIVEDCNLFTTTLRLSRTNEISSVNNGAIANTRIVNHGRSFNALVNILLPMRMQVTSDQIQIVESALQQYIREKRIWASLINFRITKVDPSNNLIIYSARVQSFRSWQDLLPVLEAKGNLEQFCAQILLKLGIHYETVSLHHDVNIKEFPDQELPIHQTDFPPDEVEGEAGVSANMFYPHNC